MEQPVQVRAGATGTRTGTSSGVTLKSLPAGTFTTIEKLDRGGSLQARKLTGETVQFYWRYSHEGRTFREPIGHYDPAAPPKKREPTLAGYSLAGARERCRLLAEQHGQRKNTGGLRQAKSEERDEFKARSAAQAERSTRTLQGLLDTYVAHLRALGRRSHVDAAGIFKAHVTGAWTKLADAPAADLSADDVLDMQRRLIEQGKGRTANKLRSYLHAAYQCAIDVRMSAALPVAFKAYAIHVNPVAQTKRDPKFDRADKRPLSAAELKTYWQLIRKLPGLRGSVLRLHLLTGGQRVHQFVKLRWVDATTDTLTIFDAKGRPGQGPRSHVLPLLRKAVSTMQEFERQGEYVMTTTKGRCPIGATTVTGWAHDSVGDAIEGFQLKRIRSGVETLLAANGISREIRGHLQSHGLTGVQARHYDGHDYMPEKRQALEVLHVAIEPTRRKRVTP
jgi:integrase